MEQIQEFTHVGHFHFDSKDKTNHYYVCQCLVTSEDGLNNLRGNLINVFVTREEYTEILKMPLGSVVKVRITPNFETNKVSYKIVL